MQLVIDNRLKTLKAALLGQTTINKWSRGAGDSGTLAILQIFANQGLDFGGGHILFKAGDIQLEVDGNLIDRLFGQLWFGKQPVVKLPEFALFSCGHSGLGSGKGHFVKIKRHVFENQFDRLRIFFEHLLEQRQDLAAVRSLKIGE